MKNRILIVEDQQPLLDLYKEILADYDVITARSDVEAFDKFFAKCPCLILMDLNLGPHSLTGDVICKQIMDLEPTTKVICISGNPEISEPEYGLKNRFYGVLKKPVRPVELLTAVKEALRE